MLTSTAIRDIAREMRAAQDEMRQLTPFSARVPGFDLASAYAAADLMHEARVADGARLVGRKIGFTNADMWSQYGVREPVWAYVYEDSVRYVAAQHASCSLAGLAEPKIEPEIIFHFRSAPPPCAGIQFIVDAIDWVAHGFEVVQSHFPGWRFEAADTVVDSVLHGALLIGEPQPLERLAPDPVAALQAFRLALSCDGVERETGVGANVLGSPLIALAYLVEVLSKQPDALPLQAGEIVSTGTITTAYPVRAGESWRTRLEGIALPGLGVEFT